MKEGLREQAAMLAQDSRYSSFDDCFIYGTKLSWMVKMIIIITSQLVIVQLQLVQRVGAEQKHVFF